MPPLLPGKMLIPAKFFRLLNEFVFVLLGALLIWVAVTGRYFFNPRASEWVGLGVFLIFWGLLAWRRGAAAAPRGEHRVRGGSLTLVGLLMLAIACMPFSWIAPLLSAAGGILMLRGFVSGVLAVRTP